ncbi:tetratricopeptide repeat protein [Psychrosphaera sp. B3R10]|uniref:tetratricopeptide repeat protein n=1 Tax=unclassified Psychrosphaera TaxID=2641570 RepID=UPI001C0963D0|nr:MULTISPECIES: tetratricopeptide repeat protein [unclassified Psychrosphaera]MBU2881387.1 tetratricopeptide repeat protein [Psychrosphaera sp. I2R16]MBU2989601.1 tetratricopeptide repeat protein [Psychrosphaera sp. B3R10]
MKTKTWVFRVIAFLIPILFFVAIEFALRFSGFGKSIPLFIENPAAPHYLLPMPQVVGRYFANDKLAPNVTIEPNFFLKKKPKDGIRLFVQGGSTAAGFPYGLGASIAGMLDYRLKQTFPEQTVEVVNTALSAVNSYTLLDFADEIIEQKPDAVLIYAGHNEYLGILGVGSNYTAANSRGATLMYLKLKDLRIFQLMQRIYYWFAQPEMDQSTGTSRTVMAKVAKHKNIEVDSDLFNAGLAQFEGNMALLLGKYQRAGIPVFISSIGSNLVDQAPFVSKPISVDYVVNALASKKVSSDNYQDTQANLNQETQDNYQDTHSNLNQETQQTNIRNSVDTHRSINGTEEIKLALARFALTQNAKTQAPMLQQGELEVLHAMANLRSANAHYWLGQYNLSKFNIPLAKQHFEAARQNDLLRFRGPNEINGIIKKLAEEFSAIFVDANLALERASPQGIIDESVMIEHLHPTVKGYFEISDVFYTALKKSELFGKFRNEIPRSQAQSDIPLLRAEVYWGAAKIAGLMADYPFTDEPKRVVLPLKINELDEIGFAAYKKKIDWMTLATETQKLAKKNNDVELYLRTAKLLADAIPNDSERSFNTGIQLIQGNKPLEAIRFLKRVLIENPKDVNARLALAHAYSEVGKLNKALTYLEAALELDPTNKTALENIPQIKRHLN